MTKKHMLFMALAVLQVIAVAVQVPAAAAQGTSFAESFEDGLPGTLEQSGPLTPDFTSGAAVFTGGNEFGRTYLRTAANYDTTNFVAEMTVTVTSGFGGSGLAFVGFGAGVPNCGFFCEPMTAPSIYARIGPNDFGPFVAITNGAVENIGSTVDGGDGTHRVRITWNHVTGGFTFAIHRNYAGGPFVPTSIIGPVVVTDVFGDTNSRIFFGGAGNATFDDLRVVALAGTPGDANCHGASISGLAHEFRGMAKAAEALGFSAVVELQALVQGFCGG